MSLSPPSPKLPLPAEEKLKKLKLKAFRKLVETDEFASHYAKIITEIGATDRLFQVVKKKFSTQGNFKKDDLLTCVTCGVKGDFNCSMCASKYFTEAGAIAAIEPLINYYLSNRFEFISDKGTMSVPLMELAAILLFRSNDFNGVKSYYPIPSHLFTVTGFGSISDCKKTTKVPRNMMNEESTPMVTAITLDEMENILKTKKIMDADNGKKINLGYITLPGSAVDPTIVTTDPTDTVLLSFNPAVSKQYIISMIVPRSSTSGATIRFTFQEILLNGDVPTGSIDEYTWTCTAENLTFNYEKQQPVVGGRRRRKTKSKTKRIRSRSKRLRMRSRTRKGNKKNKSSRTRR
jgi:hypothetical protein